MKRTQLIQEEKEKMMKALDAMKWVNSESSREYYHPVPVLHLESTTKQPPKYNAMQVVGKAIPISEIK